MGKPYSIDLRQRILNAYFNKEGSQRLIAERFNVSPSFVRDLLYHYRTSGDLQPKPHGGRPKLKLDPVALEHLRQLSESNNDFTLEELRQHLPVAVSVPTVYRALKRLALTHKKNTSRYGTR